MKNMFKKVTLLMMMLMCTLALCACGGEDAVVEDTEPATTEPQFVVEEREESELNLLTGEDTLSEEAKGKRPVAVMVNNIKPAFPQYGVAQADIIFEVLVEGNQTRFMCLYGDYTQVPKICSVRSARKYFPALSEGFDAIYVHWGMAEPIREYVESLDLTRYDGNEDGNGLYGRDKDRKAAGYSLEHTGYFDGTKLVSVLEKNKERTDIEADKNSTAFLFNAEDVTPEGKECTKVTVKFGAATAVFDYNAETGTYFKMHNGEKHMDGKAGTQLEFENVFVLETEIGLDPNGTHKDVKWQAGTGYYACNGVVQEITFKKDSEQSRLLIFDADGKELSINPGKSYFAINETGKSSVE